MFRKLTDKVLASPQIGRDEVAAAATEGVTLIINNRPEGESDDQTAGAEIEAAAKAAGLGYVAIPVTHAGFSEAQVKSMAEALAGADGKVLARARALRCSGRSRKRAAERTPTSWPAMRLKPAMTSRRCARSSTCSPRATADLLLLLLLNKKKAGAAGSGLYRCVRRRNNGWRGPEGGEEEVPSPAKLGRSQ
jgi:uncharacterized protein (TIGR01244 family)